MTQESTTPAKQEDTPVVPGAWYNIVLHPKVQRFIICIIILNTITLGLETSKSAMESIGGLLYAFDIFALGIYTVEMVLKLMALRTSFFRNGWNIFDFLIVGIAYAPAVGSLSVLRSLRVLRALRVVSAIPRLRVIVRSLIVSLPSIGWISLLLMVVFYVFAVMATRLFGAAFPDWFGNLGESYYTLFQILTLESWSMGIVRPIMEQFPYAWTFFVPFILLTSFVVLNVFIAVIVGAMNDIREEEQKISDNTTTISTDELLKAEIASMREHLAKIEALSLKNK